MAAATSSSSGGNPSRQWIYDVFINFRGEDTRKNFISHLYAALCNAGINTFLDDENLQKGESLGPELCRAIQGSRISIVVFSPSYVHSSWCVNELVLIMECRENLGQVVLPVFHGVAPSFLRHYCAANFNLESMHKEDNHPEKGEYDIYLKMEKALDEASSLSGWDIKNHSNENSVVKQIVSEVLKKLDKNYLPTTDYPVGLVSRVEKLVELLRKKISGVCILGIWGMGGVGKSTIAKVMYNKLCNEFEYQSFLANIREVWEKDRGKTDLQEQLLSDILKTRDMKVHSIEWGRAMIKERLCTKKALVILDDVNKLEQLNALCANHEVIGPGSIIIITTRDVRLLDVLKVDYFYEVEELRKLESLELLSWHAFKEASPKANFLSLSKSLGAYCRGLPLALEVLGSYLYKRSTTEWQNVLSKLKKIPDPQIHEILKISFDGLRDDMERDIYLDICCFFIGKDRAYVTEILNGCGLHADIGITVLVERSLIKVERNNRLGMHDLLRDMGREIVRKSAIHNLEKRTRLWRHEDVLDVLTKNTGTDSVEGLSLRLPGTTRYGFNAKAFEGMERLRLMQLDNVKLIGDYGYLPKQLKWIYWRGFPLNYIPNKINQGNVVAMSLKHSNVKLVWKEPQLLECLKILNLSHSKYLKSTPDFSKLPNLEKLILKDCPSLSKIHQSIGDLSNLLLLNLKDCTSLTNLPREIYRLKSVKTLIISGCTRIDKLEEDIEQMESLTTLIAENTAVKQVPFSIVRSKNIVYISLCGYEGLSRDVFPSLLWSWMSPTTKPFSSFHPLGTMPPSLVSVSLQNDYWGNLSPMLSNLSELRSVRVQCETEFQLSKEFSKILDEIQDVNFTEVEIVSYEPQISNQSLRSYLIGMGSYQGVFNILNNSISQVLATNELATNESGDIILPGDNKPYWSAHTGEGHSVHFTVPQDNHRHMKGMALCIVYSSKLENSADECLISVLIVNYTKCSYLVYRKETTISFNDEDWQGLISHLESGDKVEIFVTFGHELAIKKTFVYLIYDHDSINMEMGSSLEITMKYSSLEPMDSSVEPIEPMDSSVEPMLYSSLAPKNEQNKNAFLRFIKKIVTCICHEPVISNA